MAKSSADGGVTVANLYDLSTSAIRRIYDRRVSGIPVLDVDSYFPDAGRFLDAWTQLHEEALRVAEDLGQIPRFHELMPEQAEISANDGRDWRILVLKAYGTTLPGNTSRCPVLARTVASSPDVLSAALSFLAPGKHVPEHRGPFRGVIRFYMGLSVPVAPDGHPAAVLTIDHREHRIGNGECILWDDTFPHEVLNRGDRVRIALLLDIRRRGMPLDMALLSRALISAVGLSVRLRRRKLDQA